MAGAETTSFSSVSDLANAMRRAEAAHGEHEKRTGVRDENWPEWYAAYMVAEQSGTEPPTLARPGPACDRNSPARRSS